MESDSPFDEDELCILSGHSNVLLLARSGSDFEEAVCTELLRLNPIDEACFICVSLEESSRRRVEDLTCAMNLPEETLVLRTIGPGSESSDAISKEVSSDRSIILAELSNPDTLSSLGIHISDVLESWKSHEGEIIACVHSVTSMLSEHEIDTVFQFLLLLTNHFDHFGVRAHYHLDSVAIDEETRALISLLMDAVVTENEKGDPSVSIMDRH